MAGSDVSTAASVVIAPTVVSPTVVSPTVVASTVVVSATYTVVVGGCTAKTIDRFIGRLTINVTRNKRAC